MLKAATIALATFLFSVLIAADVVFGQTTSPTTSPTSTVAPTASPAPTSTAVQGEKTIPSGAPNTGRG